MEISNEPRDRLSELPDSLIFSIFEFLPMKYVVRTQILSHRWENLWTLTPYLYFDNGYGPEETFRNFVNRALLCWRGRKIQKFKVTSEHFDKLFFTDMDLWLRFAIDNGVEELDSFSEGINLCYDDYRLPKCLSSCSSLKKLSFFGSIMEINGNGVKWNQLKSLNIFCFLITQHAIHQVLSTCPVLEVFILSFQGKDSNLSLSFRSTSLKELSVCKGFKSVHARDDDVSTSELRIWTPNLEILSFHGIPYGKCLLMNVASLTHANLWFDKQHDYIWVTLGQILPTIRHVEGLTLSALCFKVLEAMTTLSTLMSNSLLSSLSGVVYLNLNSSFEEHERIVDLLEIFPKLKTLVMQEDANHIVRAQAKANCSKNSKRKKFKPNPSNSFIVELRTVEVTWIMLDFSIFPLIKILLRYASKLEKMVFRAKRINRHVPSMSLSLASQKLLKMPRSSPTAELIIREC